MNTGDSFSLSLSSISQLGKSCSELVQQHNASSKELERKILSFYVKKQTKIPVKEISDQQELEASDEIEDDGAESVDQNSFEKPKTLNYASNVKEVKINQTLNQSNEPLKPFSGELEYKRGRIFSRSTAGK